jgi:hypothetical protein
VCQPEGDDTMRLIVILKMAEIAAFLMAFIVCYFLWKHKHKAHSPDLDALTKLLQPNDVIISWGYGFTNYLVSLLINLRDVVKNAPSHSMHIHEPGYAGSAEANGYKIMEIKDLLKRCYGVVVFRKNEVKEEDIKALQELTLREKQQKYNYALYIINMLKIFQFFVPFIFVWLSPVKSQIFLGIVLLTYTIGMKLLRSWEKKTAACSETESWLLNKIGYITLVTDHLSISPHALWMILANRSDFTCVVDFVPACAKPNNLED